MQYSCQQNFTLLTTDGYWNAGDNSVPNEGQGRDLTTSSTTFVGNLDGGTTPRPMYEGPTATSGTLADIAKYYYDTDLRASTRSNCTGSLGLDVCENNVFASKTDTQKQQHMTTFTLGLGVDGTLSFTNDYESATSGDYYNLKNGYGTPTVNWPVPSANSETAVDDLWHAAVNGKGTYFSAKDPAQLATGLNNALAAIGSKLGASSAAATSTLNPVAGDNYAYVASYTTVKWTGNLEARTINVNTGQVSTNATWCVEDVPPAGSCNAPSTLETDSSGSSLRYLCVTPNSDAAKCAAPGVLVGTDCKVEQTASCTGKMADLVKPLPVSPTAPAPNDKRKILKADGSGGLEELVYDNLDATEKNYFKGDGLSQWAVLTADQKTAAAGANLVNYLRGQTGFEDRLSNPAANRLYRFREATLGDALESQPVFISKPVFSYADPGYATFASAKASREGTVFMGTNDGMLHAFNAADGTERWAFVPKPAMPNLWKLADKNYANLHTNFVNGSPTISDICVQNCNCDDACLAGADETKKPVWKSILVGGLNAGGRGYFALDVTDPASPTLLWEITSESTGFDNLGYSFGRPVITKKEPDTTATPPETVGKWVVLLTSGYNNISPGNGRGSLFVVDAASGSKISEIDTGAGDGATPSGLAKVAAYNEYGGINNTAGPVYGGDILGNVWRFDINNGGTIGNPGSVFLFATLKDGTGKEQPVTTPPVLGLAEGKRVVYVGTGKYLEQKDLVDLSPQTIYAIVDNNSTTTLLNARNSLVEQTMTENGNLRTGSANQISLASDRGWYVQPGERQCYPAVCRRTGQYRHAFGAGHPPGCNLGADQHRLRTVRLWLAQLL